MEASSPESAAGPTGKIKLDTLQVCRGIAALLVVFYHDGLTYFPIYRGTYDFVRQARIGSPWITDFWHAGVDFFFVISGFIIFLIHRDDVGKPNRCLPYVRKRFIRIYPTYWVALAIVVPIYFALPQLGSARDRELASIVQSFLLLPFAVDYPIITSAWTLSHELLFYFIFCLYMAVPRFGLAILSAWFALVFSNIFFIEIDSFPLTFVAAAQNIEFAMGMIVAFYVRKRAVPLPWLVATLGAALFIGFGYMQVFVSPSLGDYQAIGYGTGSALMVLGVVGAEMNRPVAMPRLLLLIGNASYSIYLVHMALLSAFARGLRLLPIPPVLDGWPIYFVMAASAALGGIAFHMVVERPALRLNQLFAGRMTPSRELGRAG
jgi:exopolysaccharide production protein ExoZ